MKKLLIIAGLALLFAQPSGAQTDDHSTKGHIKKGAQKTGQGIKKGAKAMKKGGKKVGHQTAEIGSRGKAKIDDRVYDGKKGPTGETVYIDEQSRYYWIDDKGHHVYLSELELRDK
ncbi:MAG: hypothetical protein EOO01_06565 [Chitinophagaceae bacterium]|nr:MAG: hypothetical protein EOO01_06565 [Chitinophagaceae bacterium]